MRNAMLSACRPFIFDSTNWISLARLVDSYVYLTTTTPVLTQPDRAPEDLIRDEMSTRGGVSISSSSEVLSPAEKSDVFAELVSLKRRA